MFSEFRQWYVWWSLVLWEENHKQKAESFKPTWEPKQWVGEKNKRCQTNPTETVTVKVLQVQTDATAASKTFTGKPKGSRGWKRKKIIKDARLPLLGTPGDLSIDCYQLIGWTSVSPAGSPWWLILEQFLPSHINSLPHTPHTPKPPSQVPSQQCRHLHLKVRPTGLAHDHASQTRTKGIAPPDYSVLFNII